MKKKRSLQYILLLLLNVFKLDERKMKIRCYDDITYLILIMNVCLRLTCHYLNLNPVSNSPFLN